MMKTKITSPFSYQSLVPLLLLLVAGMPLFAQTTRTWTGGGSDNNWNTPANWGGTAPVNFDNLTFSGTARQNNTNNLLTDVGTLVFSSAGWDINGDAVTKTAAPLTHNIAGQSVWRLNTSLSLGTHLITINNGNARLTFAGVLSGDGDLKKNVGSNGRGTLVLANSANSFAGAADLGTGPTEITKFANAGQASSLGAGMGTILVGSTASGYATTLNYVGTEDSATDRSIQFAMRDGSTLTFNNNSPNNANLTFDGGFTVKPWNSASALSLGGSSTGTNTINGGILQNASLSAHLWINGPGRWVLNGSSSLTGETRVNSGTLALGPVASITSAIFTVLPGGVLDVRELELFGGFILGAAGNTQTLKIGRTNTPATDVFGSLHAGNSTSQTLDIAGTGTAGTLTISSNFTPGFATLLLDLSDNTTAGNDINDLIVVGGDLILNSGMATLNINALNGVLQTETPYTIIKYSGNLLGDASGLQVPALGRAYTATVSTATPKEVRVTIHPSGLPPANLVWQGDGFLNSWDVALNQSWLNGGVSDFFYQGDNVTFNDTSANLTVNLATVLVPSSIVVTSAQDYVFTSSGSIAGSATLTKLGSGKLTIQTANTHSGPTAVAAGSVIARHSSALGSGYITLGTAASGTNAIALLQNNSATTPNAVNVSSSATGEIVIGREGGAGTKFTGPITLERDVTFTSAGPMSSSGRFAIEGGLAGTGDVTVGGGGMHTWSVVPNTFSGNVFVKDDGTLLQVNSATAVPDTSSVDIATNTILQVFGAEMINALTGQGLVRPVQNNYTLTVGAADGSGTFAGSFADNAGDLSHLNLTKAGAGTQILTGDNSLCSGSTTVAGGVLAVNNAMGSGLGSGTVVVNSAGTLAGSGSVDSGTNNVTVNGRLSVGNSGDTAGSAFTLLNTSPAGITFNPGASLEVDLFTGAGAGDNSGVPSAADRLALTGAGSVTFNSATLIVSNASEMSGWAAGDKWNIIDLSTVPSGTFTAFDMPALPAGLAWDFSDLYSTGVIGIQVGPPTIGFEYAAGSLTLTWPANGSLQAAPEASGVYTNVPGATSPYTITDFTAPRMFYRIMMP